MSTLDPMSPVPPEHVLRDLERLGLALDPPRLAQLAGYLDRLLEANRRINLTAVREPDVAWQRLIVDSLTLLPRLARLPAGRRVADIGSGGGLPGIPVAIARPDLHVTLIEATGKKCEILDGFVTALELPRVAVVNGRAETLAHREELRARFDVVTSRALGALPVVLELTLPFARVGGVVIAMKGPAVREEIPRAKAALKRLRGGPPMVTDSYPPGFANELVLVEVEKTASTPAHYPRTPGTPKKQPL